MTKTEALAALEMLGEEFTLEELRRAYREAAEKFHPDKSGGNEEKFRKLPEARKILENFAVQCLKCGGEGRLKTGKGLRTIYKLCGCQLKKK